MDTIKKLMEEYKFLKEQEDFKIGFSAQMDWQEELIEFINGIKKIGDQLEGYGNPVHIVIDIFNSAGQEVPFKLTLNHYCYDKDPNRYLIGRWIEHKERDIDLYYSFHPLFKSNYKKENKELYIDGLSFVFLQLYKKRDLIYKKFEEKIIEDLIKKINFSKNLLDIVKKI